MITKKKKFYQARVWIVLAIGIIGFLIVTNWRIKQKRAELQERSEVLKKEIQILEEKINNLKAGITQTETDDYQTEKLYKEGYFPAGSVPVVVLPPEGEAVEKDETAGEKNPWQRFLDKLRF